MKHYFEYDKTPWRNDNTSVSSAEPSHFDHHQNLHCSYFE